MKWDQILIASDIDGTLLPGGREIPERNLSALRRFAEKGGRFTLATGRSIGSAGQFLDRLPVNAPAICLNGALLYDYEQKKVLESCPLAKETAAPLLKQLYDRFPTLGMECFYQDSIGIVRRTSYIKNTKTPELYSFTDGTETACFAPWMKLFFGGEPALVQEAMAFAETLPHDGLRYVFSSENYLEILPSGANKGKLLHKLAAYLEIPLAQVYAIGDFYNDEELLQAAGHAVVPANAPEQLQKQAELVVCSCTDGALADLVEYLEQLCSNCP